MNKDIVNNIVKHVAIIMDGNYRWAQKKSMPFKNGHKKSHKIFNNKLIADFIVRKTMNIKIKSNILLRMNCYYTYYILQYFICIHLDIKDSLL